MYIPNLFGSAAAMEAWEKISGMLGYTGDYDFKIGDRPYLELISKTRLLRERKNLLQAIQEDEQKSKDRYALGVYSPEGVLIIGWLLMEKGLPLTSAMDIILRDALLIEKNKASRLTDPDIKRLRNQQINHFFNRLSEYEPSPGGTRVLLYGTNETRRKKRDKAFREKQRRARAKDRKMSPEDIRNLAYTWMLMRMLNGVKETNRLFSIYAPNINTRDLGVYMLNNGFCDDRYRPNKHFRDHIYWKLKDWKAPR